MKVLLKDSGLLQWQNEQGIFEEVNIVDSFPLSEPGKYLSLVNEKGEEVEYIEDMELLDIASKEVLQKALKNNNFFFEILDVLKVEEQQELRCYEVLTRQGLRKVFTPLDEWPSRQINGSIKLEDLFGDVYIISEFARLPEPSQKLLSYYVE